MARFKMYFGGKVNKTHLIVRFMKKRKMKDGVFAWARGQRVVRADGGEALQNWLSGGGFWYPEIRFGHIKLERTTRHSQNNQKMRFQATVQLMSQVLRGEHRWTYLFGRLQHIESEVFPQILPSLWQAGSAWLLPIPPTPGSPQAATDEKQCVNTPAPMSLGGMVLKLVFYAVSQHLPLGLSSRHPQWQLA